MNPWNGASLQMYGCVHPLGCRRISNGDFIAVKVTHIFGAHAKEATKNMDFNEYPKHLKAKYPFLNHSSYSIDKAIFSSLTWAVTRLAPL